jgi:hypothetical protein
MLRGLAVAGMIMVTDPGTYSAVYPQLLHAQWNGATATGRLNSERSGNERSGLQSGDQAGSDQPEWTGNSSISEFHFRRIPR